MPRPNRGTRLSDKPNDHGYWEILPSKAGYPRRISTGTADRTEATRALAGFILESDRSDKKSETPLINRLFDWYMESDHVVDKVADKIRIEQTLKFLRPFFGELPIDELTDDHVSDYKRKRRTGKIANKRGKGVQNVTIRRELTTLKAAITAAHKAGKITGFPYINLPSPGVPRDRWLTHEEADRLKAAAARGWTPESNRPMPRLLLFIWLALETASRRKAIEQLTWFQVDFPNRLIYLNPKGREQTTKFRPTVPISNALLPILIRAKNESTNEFVLYSRADLYKSFRRAVKRAGLGRDVVAHVLRHTYATWAAQRRVPMGEIAGVLGDSEITVTRIYRHHAPEYLRGAVDYDRGQGG